MPHAIVILADGFEEVEAVTIIDLLRRGGVKVTVLGLNTIDVRGAHDLRVKADMLLDDFRDGAFDAIVLPGGMPGTKNLAESKAVIDLIHYAHDLDKLIAAICAAPSVLAKAGILDSRKATCYPGIENALSGALLVTENVVVDYNIITGRAVGAAIPFALELIKTLVGDTASEMVASAILYH